MPTNMSGKCLTPVCSTPNPLKVRGIRFVQLPGRTSIRSSSTGQRRADEINLDLEAQLKEDIKLASCTAYVLMNLATLPIFHS